MAIMRPVAALFTGVMGGSVSLLMQKKYQSSYFETTSAVDDHACGCSSENCSSDLGAAAPAAIEERKSWLGKLKSKTLSLFSYGFMEFTDDIAIPFLIGLLIAGVLSFSSFFRIFRTADLFFGK